LYALAGQIAQRIEAIALPYTVNFPGNARVSSIGECRRTVVRPHFRYQHPRRVESPIHNNLRERQEKDES
jgi:hypothetical protein